jgi:ABC-type molybdate transport system permease subunit
MSPFWSTALISTAGAFILGIILGYLVSTQRTRSRTVIELLLWAWVLVPFTIVHNPIAVVALFSSAAFQPFQLQRDAARALGASDWRIFWNILLPGGWLRILAGTVLAGLRAVIAI